MHINKQDKNIFPLKLFLTWISGMSEGEGQGGQLPPQILADQKAPPGSGGAPHYYLPPQIFRLCNMPEVYIYTQSVLIRNAAKSY